MSTSQNVAEVSGLDRALSLHKLPDGWSTRPMFSVVDVRDESNTGMRVNNLLSLSFGRIVRKDIATSEGLLPASYETYQVVHAGDLVFRFTDLQNDQRSLRSGLVWERGIITSAYLAVTPRGGILDSRFFAYQMRAYDSNKVFYGQAGGVRQGLKYADVRRLPIVFPPLDEQRAIADYIDDQTAKIDALIAKQERMIELLEERRKSVIATFVVRGLDHRVAMRDTGIGWLGEVPQHWTQVPTRAALTVEKDLVGSSWADTQLLSLTKRGVVTRDIDSGEGKFPASFEDYQRVEPGDLVFCLFDLDETPRTVGLVRDRGMLTGAYTRFRVKDSVADAAYLEYYYVAIDDRKRFRPLYTGLRKVIQKPRFLGAPMVLPPLNEQRLIAEHIDRETSKIDALIAKTREHIALAKERRAALITAAVTGQIDVRTATREVA